MGEQTIWGIHGGKTGDADSLFLNSNVIAIGWAKVGEAPFRADPKTKRPRSRQPS